MRGARQYWRAIVTDCDAAIALNPNDASTYYNRGVAGIDSEQYAQAIQNFDKALELNPNYDEAYRNHELCFERLSEQDEASVDENIPPYVRQVREQNIRDHSRALKLNPNDAMTYNNRGAEYAALGKNRAALRDYNRAIRLAPNKSMLHKNRALTYKRLKQYDEAIQDLSKALALNPNDAFAYNERGSIYFELEKYEQAIQDFDKVIEFKDFYEPDAYRRRGNAYLKLEQYERAIRDYNEAVKINLVDEESYLNCAYCWQKLGNEAEAKAALEGAEKTRDLRREIFGGEQ